MNLETYSIKPSVLYNVESKLFFKANSKDISLNEQVDSLQVTKNINEATILEKILKGFYLPPNFELMLLKNFNYKGELTMDIKPTTINNKVIQNHTLTKEDIKNFQLNELRNNQLVINFKNTLDKMFLSCQMSTENKLHCLLTMLVEGLGDISKSTILDQTSGLAIAYAVSFKYQEITDELEKQ